MAKINVNLSLLEIPDEGLEFPQWMEKQWVRFFVEKNGSVSQNDFAKELGVSNTTLSNYISGSRLPEEGLARRLKDKLGPAILDKCGYSREMPNHPALYFVADHWALFSDEEQDDLLKRAQEFARKREEKGKSIRRAFA
jgi:transcriptional regulator with XRE-family HTH domain